MTDKSGGGEDKFMDVELRKQLELLAEICPHIPLHTTKTQTRTCAPPSWRALSFDCHLIFFTTSFNITILSLDTNEVDLSLGIIIFNCAIN